MSKGMLGVEAQIHELRISVGQEALDPVLGMDVGVHVRVEDQVDAELLGSAARYPSEVAGVRD